TTGSTTGLFEAPACTTDTEPEYTPAALPVGSTEMPTELEVELSMIHGSLAVAVIASGNRDASLGPKYTTCPVGVAPPTWYVKMTEPGVGTSTGPGYTARLTAIFCAPPGVFTVIVPV